MKKLCILIFCTFFPVILLAQEQVEYNRKGDNAMRNNDYSDARMWYEDGISSCDLYSISKLTKIWQSDEKMHLSMRGLMMKCHNCLNVQANENDSTSIKLLIVYYKEGIGIPKSEELAEYWIGKLEKLREPEVVEPQIIPTIVPKKRQRMRFLVGYAYSIEAPYGLTVGGVMSRFGWYARFRTNASSLDYTMECDNKSIIDFKEDASYAFDKKDIDCYLGSAGMIIKCLPWLYTSIGLGYGERRVLWHYTTTDFSDMNIHDSGWCKNRESTYKGVVAEMDVMVKLGPIFLSAGCNTINFKYADLNAGLGVFF